VSFVDGAVKNLQAGDDPRVGSAMSGPALHMVDGAGRIAGRRWCSAPTTAASLLVSAIETA
jgi:alpha,alpha-trehalose phosphorylase